MQKFEVSQTPRTPYLLIDFEMWCIIYRGRFIPDVDPFSIMIPFCNAIKEYCSSPPKITPIDVYYEYVNTGSLKLFSDSFKLMKLIEKADGEIVCRWHIDDPSDDDNIEMCNDISIYSGLKIQLTIDKK